RSGAIESQVLELLSRRTDADDSHFIHATASNVQPPIQGGHYVADDIPSGRYVPALELLGRRIEAHQGIRLDAGFVVPDCSVSGRRHSIRLGSRALWRQPFADLAGHWIESAEITAGVVGIIDAPVRRDSEPPRPRARG